MKKGAYLVPYSSEAGVFIFYRFNCLAQKYAYDFRLLMYPVCIKLLYWGAHTMSGETGSMKYLYHSL